MEQKSANYLFAYEILKAAYPNMKGLNVRSIVMTQNYGNAYYQSQNKYDVIAFISIWISDGGSMTLHTNELRPIGDQPQQTQSITFTTPGIYNFWIRTVYIGIASSSTEEYVNACIYEPIL